MSRSARTALLAVVVAASATGCGRREFRVTGTVTIASHLQSRAPKENCVMFIVAKNLGGVPVAVKRIVNPQFPVAYALGIEDLVVPGIHPKDVLRIEVEMNTHGNVGKPQRGDLAGSSPDRVTTGDRRVHIVIEKQL